jgi:hypothetical protein
MNLDHGAAQQPDELRSFLARRERELTHQLAVLRGQIESKQRELAEIQRVRANLAPSPPSLPDTSSFERAADDVREAANRPRVDLMQQADNPPVAVPSSNEKLTIKSMILTALSSHFHDGATPAELRTFIKDAFGREIDRTSMSPQLARLREDGAVEQTDTKWRLSERVRQRGVANYLQPQKLEDT